MNTILETHQVGKFEAIVVRVIAAGQRLFNPQEIVVINFDEHNHGFKLQEPIIHRLIDPPSNLSEDGQAFLQGEAVPRK